MIDSIIEFIKTFLMLFFELLILFIIVSFIVSLIQQVVSEDKIKSMLSKPNQGINYFWDDIWCDYSLLFLFNNSNTCRSIKF